ncbi:Acyltransferase family protein [Lutibacter oricola]|uniref:Acyltransferase family protein n=1 Tax=Lutibacter oricola TaxID=762486 RepID=A0A1H3FSJ7_9FLAO|nr:Acyltransferase family protein [Lutibacter oricola]
MRNKTIDSLKGFAILLVVIGHIIQATYPNFDENLFFRLIYSFHMPLFFFLSGFVSKKEVTIKSIKKYFVGLIIPFIVWALISQIYSLNISGGTYDFIYTGFIKTLIFPDNGLWYLYILFGLHILTWIEFKTSLVYVIIIIIMLSLLSYFIGNGNIFGLKAIVIYTPYFYLGRFVFFNDMKIKVICIKYKFLFGLLFLFFAWSWHRTNINFFSISFNSISMYIYKYWVAFLAIFWFYGLFLTMKLNVLETLGTHTLIIYILNSYFTPFLKHLFISNYYTLSLIISCVLICVISILIEGFFYKNKFLAYILLGKIK